MLRISGGISDENFNGSRVRDTEDKNRFSKEGADFLKDALAKAIQPTKNLSATNKEKISQVSSKMTQALADNTEAVQKIMSEQDDTRKEFLKLISMMTDAQKKTGESSQVAMKEIIKQIERVKLTDGEGTKDVAKILGLDAAQKEIAKPLGRQTMTGALVEKLTNVDIRKESITKAFTLEKMFGLKPGSDDILKSAQDEVAAGKINTEAAEAKAAVAEATLGDTSTVTEKVGKVKEAKEKEINTTTVPVVTTNSEGGQAFATGTDRISPDFQQVDLLEQILEQLKKMEKVGGGGGLSLAALLASPAVRAALVAAALAVAKATVIGSIVAGSAYAITKAIDMFKEKTGPTWEEFKNRPENAGKTDEELTKALRIESGIDSPLSDPNYDMTQDPAYPLLKAKRTGLYDKDYVGNSEVDLNMLAATTDTAQLQAILDDNDLSDTDRMRVSSRLEQIKRETPATPEISPTQTPPATPEIAPSTPEIAPSTPEIAPDQTPPATPEIAPSTPEIAPDQTPATPEILPPSKGEAVSQLADIGTMPLVGAGVLSMEAQGLEKVVSPTADAVNNVSDLVENILSSITNNIQNITNNNNTSGGGAQAPNVLMNPPTARNAGSAWSEYLNKLATGR
jgi:hypothetical protein